jgi:hypothetical protein
MYQISSNKTLTMKKPWRCLPFLLVAFTTGCATIVEGGAQVITVTTVPSGASCTFDRGGQRIGVIFDTPGSLAVNSSRTAIVVTCEKPGYEPVAGSDVSQSDGAIFSNILLALAAPIGMIVDMSTEADYHYGATIIVTFPQPRPGFVVVPNRQG